MKLHNFDSRSLEYYKSLISAAMKNPVICNGKCSDNQALAWFGDAPVSTYQIAAKQAEVYADYVFNSTIN